MARRKTFSTGDRASAEVAIRIAQEAHDSLARGPEKDNAFVGLSDAEALFAKGEYLLATKRALNSLAYSVTIRSNLYREVEDLVNEQVAYRQWDILLEMRRRVESAMEESRNVYADREDPDSKRARDFLRDVERAWERRDAKALYDLGALGDVATDLTGLRIFRQYVATTKIEQEWPPLWNWQLDEYPHRHENPAGGVHKVTATSTGRYNGGAAVERRHGSSTVTIFTIEDPTEPGGQRFHKYESYGENASKRREHALQQHAARHGITNPIKHVRGSRSARSTRIAASARPDVGAVPEGYHQIAEAQGPRNVKTVYRKGLYYVHGGATPSGTGRGNSKASYTLTHGPSGLAIGRFSTKVNASAAARHFDSVAPKAGARTVFGDRPSESAFDELRAAFKSLPSKLLR